jgi:PAS domain S-box-containing protein
MRLQNKTRSLLTPSRIAIFYILLGGLWVVFSDGVLQYLNLSQETFTLLGTLKGWLFIIVSGSLLYSLIKYYAYERTKAENDLRNNHEQLVSILDGINDGFITLDRNLKYTSVNRRAGILLNQTPEECIGEYFWEIIPDAQDQYMRKTMGDALSTLEPVEFDFFHAPIQRWFVYRIYPSKNGLTIFFQDITQQKEAEAERQLQLAIIDKTSDLVGLATPDGTFTYLNRAGIEMLGFDPSKGDIRKNIADTHPQWAYDIVSSTGLPTAAKKGLWKGETVLLDFNGREVPVSQLIMSHRTPDGALAYFSCVIREITELKRKEDALIESEEKFSKAFQVSPNGMIITRASDNVIIDVNEYFIRASGYAYEEIIGNTSVDLKLWIDQSDRNKFLTHIMQDGKVANQIFYFRTKAGKIRCGSISGEIIHIGTKKCYLSIIEDITERKNAEDLIRQANERLKYLLTTASVVIYTASAIKTHAATFVSDNVINITGFSPDEFLGSGNFWHEHIHPDDKIRIQKELDSLMARDTQTFEYRFHLKDGSYKWLREECKLIRDASGALKEIIGYFTDITQRKEVEEALKVNEERLRLTLEATSDGLWDWDLSTNTLYYSPRWYTMLGYEPQSFEANYENWARITMPEDAERTQKILQDSIEKGVGFESEFRMKTADGRWRWILGRGKATAWNSQGRALRLSGTNTDMTERREAEEALRASRDQLRNYSAKLQLIREEERTYIAREIHDELGQILTALKMDLSVLDELLLEEPRITQRRDMNAKIDSMSQLMDSAIGSMRKIITELRPVVLDTMGLSAAIEWQAEEFQQRTGIACFYSPPQDIPTLPRDFATSIFRILQESLTNIMRHAGASRTTITMKLDQGNLILIIHDDGKGISEDEIDQKKSFGITGMKERVELLGGKFNIHGIKGKGTLLSVEIPLPKKI